MYEFSERTMTVAIDRSLCAACETKACVEGCRRYARGILQLDESGLPSVDHLTDAEVKRRGTECLACEYECWFRGRSAIEIEVPIEGLDEYLETRGLDT